MKSCIIGPFFHTEAAVDGEYYRAMFQHSLFPELRILNLCNRDLYQQDGAFVLRLGIRYGMTVSTQVDRYSWASSLAKSCSSDLIRQFVYEVNLKQLSIHRHYIIRVSVRSGSRTQFMDFFLNSLFRASLQLFQTHKQSGTEHVGERVQYRKRLHSMPETACTVKSETPDDELPEARNM